MHNELFSAVREASCRAMITMAPRILAMTSSLLKAILDCCDCGLLKITATLATSRQMTTLTSGLRKMKPSVNITMMFYFIMVLLLCMGVDAVIDDECRGTCDDMIGYFCLSHVGICLECAVDCTNDDYPPCGDICRGFDNPPIPSPITNSTQQTTTPTMTSSSSPHLSSHDAAFWLTSTGSTTTSSSTTGGSFNRGDITIALSVSFAVLLVALLVCLRLCPRFVQYCRRQRNKAGGRQEEGDNQHAGLEMQPLRDREIYDPFMSPHEGRVDPEAEPRHGQESQPHRKDGGQYAVDTSNPVAGVYGHEENSSVPVPV